MIRTGASTARFQAASETAAEDAVFELESVVTRQGRLVNLARLKKGHKATRDEAKAIEELLVSVTRASIEPGWAEGAPVANGKVLLSEIVAAFHVPNDGASSLYGYDYNGQPVESREVIIGPVAILPPGFLAPCRSA